MTITTQGYADLCDDSYKDRPVGASRPRGERPVFADGAAYTVLDHVNNPQTGYQGTIYQRVDTGEIVVAHRGTEFGKWQTDKVEFGRDVAQADGGMVFARTNLQTSDAIALTQKAIGYAEDYADKRGTQVIMPTITGHSLGGNLTQVTSHHFGLHGVTFNPYGGVSLNLRIGEGGNLVTNHVMAGDPVSAAGPQFGQVITYTKPEEVKVLRETSAGQSHTNSSAAAGMLVGDSHRLYNFLNNDNGTPHVSVLSDPQSRVLAQQHAPMIARYREDIDEVRTALTLGGNAPANLEHAIDSLRGPVAPGTAYRDERDQARQQAERDQWAAPYEARYALAREKAAEQAEGRQPAWMQGAHLDASATETPSLLKRPDAHATGVAPLYTPLSTYGSAVSTDQAARETPGPHAAQTAQFPSGHRDHALFSAIRSQLPEGTSQEKAAEVTLQARRGGITDPSQIKDIVVKDERVFVMGNRLGMRADADLSTPAPGLQETLRQSDVLDKQQAQDQTQFQAMQQQINSQGQGAPSLSR